MTTHRSTQQRRFVFALVAIVVLAIRQGINVSLGGSTPFQQQKDGATTKFHKKSSPDHDATPLVAAGEEETVQGSNGSKVVVVVEAPSSSALSNAKNLRSSSTNATTATETTNGSNNNVTSSSAVTKERLATPLSTTTSAPPGQIRKNKKRFWCVLSYGSMWPEVRHWGWTKSVAHVGEAILPCWSYFYQHQAVSAMGQNHECGFWFRDDLGPRAMPWGQDLMKTMNCTMQSTIKTVDGKSLYPNETQGTTTTLYDPDLDEWQEFPFQEEYWMGDTTATAGAALRQLVLPSLDFAPTQLQIGILKRTGTRKMNNVTELYETLVRTFPAANVSLESMTGFSLPQQAEWFATKHIIVAAHGAGLINAVFMQQNATLVQLFPNNFYFVGYFESLVTRVGGQNLIWYEGNVSEARDVHKEMGRNARESAKKVDSFKIVIPEIVELVVDASQSYPF